MLPVESTAMPPPVAIAPAGVLPPKYVEYAMPPTLGMFVFSLVTKNWRFDFGEAWYAWAVAGNASDELGVSFEVVVPVTNTSPLRSMAIPLAVSSPLPE